MTDLTNRPLAAPGLRSYRSYRSRGRFGYIMIGAKDHASAHREALRSCDAAKVEDLEIWDGAEYVPATSANDPLVLCDCCRKMVERWHTCQYNNAV